MKRSSIFLALFMLMFSSVSFAAELISLVPQDAMIIVNINLEKISANPTLKALYDMFIPAYSEEYTADFEKMGINPYKDIQNVLFFITSKQKFGFLADGTFDTITTCETVEGSEDIQKFYKLNSIGGLPALYNENAEQATVTLVDQRTLALGDMSVLEEIGSLYNAKEEGESIKKNASFKYMANRLDLDKQIWGVAVGGKGWDQPSVKIEKSALDKVRMTFFDIDYGDKEFNMSVTSLVARNNELQPVTDAYKELINATREFVSTVPGMTKIVDSIEVMDDKSNMVRMELKMPVEKFNEALANVAEYTENNSAEK